MKMGLFDRFIKKRDMEPKFECEYCANFFSTSEELGEHSKTCSHKKEAKKILSVFESELNSIKKVPKIKELPKQKHKKKSVHISFRLKRSAKKRLLHGKAKTISMSRTRAVPGRIIHRSTANLYVRAKPKMLRPVIKRIRSSSDLNNNKHKHHYKKNKHHSKHKRVPKHKNRSNKRLVYRHRKKSRR